MAHNGASGIKYIALLNYIGTYTFELMTSERIYVEFKKWVKSIQLVSRPMLTASSKHQVFNPYHELMTLERIYAAAAAAAAAVVLASTSRECPPPPAQVVAT